MVILMVNCFYRYSLNVVDEEFDCLFLVELHKENCLILHCVEKVEFLDQFERIAAFQLQINVESLVVLLVKGVPCQAKK